MVLQNSENQMGTNEQSRELLGLLFFLNTPTRKPIPLILFTHHHSISGKGITPSLPTISLRTGPINPRSTHIPKPIPTPKSTKGYCGRVILSHKRHQFTPFPIGRESPAISQTLASRLSRCPGIKLPMVVTIALCIVITVTAFCESIEVGSLPGQVTELEVIGGPVPEFGNRLRWEWNPLTGFRTIF